jgi:hypothetical protein
MTAAIEAISSKEMGSYKAPTVFIICLPPHSSYKMQPLDKAFMGPLKPFYCQETEKWLRSNPGRVATVYQTGKPIWKYSYKQAATDATAANACLATGLFPCDMNIFRPHDFPLASGNINAAPLNHTALVNTSHQLSFYSNFSPFTSAEALRPSDR